MGEHLWTEGGPIEISSTRLLGTGESVYNLEVHGHHIYQVTELGVLVHNANWLDKYRTRSVTSTKKLRKEFNNSKRAEFLKNLAKDPKSVLRFTADQLKLMAKGIVPKGFVVHHIVPLFRGGTNAASNLRLLKENFHRKFFSKLHYYVKGKNPYGRN